ncbi:MAG: deoxyribodipyrimidine photo-lyase [Chloroflexi bacterium]|nr:deoxyribodipyrimidine photo-lyase [Chloroflexota bacterium]
MEIFRREAELNDKPVKPGGGAVICWMQSVQRAHDNHALEYAVENANRLNLPVIVLFILDPAYPAANLRHYTFMLQGIADTAKELENRGIAFFTAIGPPVETVVRVAKSLDAAMLVTDRGYLRHLRRWRKEAAAVLKIRMIEVDTNCVIPCTAFTKEEYAAYTMRKKYNRLLPDYLVPLKTHKPVKTFSQDPMREFNPYDIDGTLKILKIDRSVPPSAVYKGGPVEARKLLDTFLDGGLRDYAVEHGNAAINSGSRLSPYLHYGHISPLRIALEVDESGTGRENVGAFLEQLLVRRELSINFTWHNENYDMPSGWPEWGRLTLDGHRKDPRPMIYLRERLEAGETGDPVWDAAQKELLASGRIHNYPRMIWAKKLLEWTKSPEEAWETAVWLNDRYALDGRDPNGFTGIAWCIGGKHDRPWPERPIFGKIRYMSTGRAGSHFNVKGYINRVNDLCTAAGIQGIDTV